MRIDIVPRRCFDTARGMDDTTQMANQRGLFAAACEKMRTRRLSPRTEQTLRVKDVAFERGELIVRDAKGGRDRVTVLPATLGQPLRAHLGRPACLVRE